MEEISKERIQKFWEGYGLKEDGYGWYFPHGDGEVTHLEELPSVTGYEALAPLFQYAWEMGEIQSIHFTKGDDGVICWVYTRKEIGKPYYGKALDSGTALFLALEKALVKE